MFFSGAAKFNRKINLTFGVFGVIPSYLVRIEHIWCVFRKTKKFDEKIFFQSQNLRFQSIFLAFSKFWKYLKCRKFWSKSEISDRKNIFSSKIFFSSNTHKICSILTKYEGITPKTPKVRLIFHFFFSCVKKKNHSVSIKKIYC